MNIKLDESLNQQQYLLEQIHQKFLYIILIADMIQDLDIGLDEVWESYFAEIGIKMTYRS